MFCNTNTIDYCTTEIKVRYESTQSLENTHFFKPIWQLWLRHLRFESLYLCQERTPFLIHSKMVFFQLNPPDSGWNPRKTRMKSLRDAAEQRKVLRTPRFRAPTPNLWFGKLVGFFNPPRRMVDLISSGIARFHHNLLWFHLLRSKRFHFHSHPLKKQSGLPGKPSCPLENGANYNISDFCFAQTCRNHKNYGL